MRENEHRQTIVLFALVVLASSVGNLAQTGLNAMLSSVCFEFGIAEGVGQWLTTSYMLVLGIVVPLSSYFMGRFRLKDLTLIAIALFAVGALVSAIAPSFAVLFLGRLAQAVAAGMLLPLVQTIAMTRFPDGHKATAMGISGIANVLCCIKMAKYYELTENDVVATVLTDSAVMYGSRIEELNQMHGAYNAHEAALDHNLHMLGLKTDSMLELTYTERKRVHNLKYYTWVEQQQMDVEDLNAQWYDTKGTWDAVHAQAKDLDELINEFNEATGLLKAL